MADLKVTKFGKPDGAVRANEVLTYTVVVDNLGPSWASAVALKDILQSSGAFELLNVKSDRPMTCAFSPNGGLPKDEPNGNIPGRLQLDCVLDAPLAVLEPAGFPNPGRWILTVRVRADEETSLNNIADVTSPALDPNPANNHAEVAHAITDVADLKIDKDSGPSVVAGTDLGYTITVTNRGPSTAENVTVFDRLPPGIVVKSATVPGGRCRTGTAGSAQDQLVCQLGTMALDEVRVITLTARVNPDVAAGTVLENDAYVTSDVFDDNNANNTDYTLTQVKSVAELGVTKRSNYDDVEDAGDDASGPVLAGTELEYVIAVSNGGPSDAAAVVVVDDLPVGTEFVSAAISVGAGSCVGLPTGQVKCQLGSLALGATVEIVLRVRVSQALRCPAGPLLDRVVVTSPSDVDGATATVSTRLDCRADLAIVKTSYPDKVKAGEQKRYRLEVTNRGPSQAYGVKVWDVLPDAATYEVDTSPNMCTQPANLVGLRAAMSPASEVPAAGGSGQGLATFVLDTDTNMLHYALFVNDLGSAVTAAHIHSGAAGVNGPVVVTLFGGAPPEFGEAWPLTGMVQLTAAQANALQANPAGHYVNVHTMGQAGRRGARPGGGHAAAAAGVRSGRPGGGRGAGVRHLGAHRPEHGGRHDHRQRGAGQGRRAAGHPWRQQRRLLEELRREPGRPEGDQVRQARW